MRIPLHLAILLLVLVMFAKIGDPLMHRYLEWNFVRTPHANFYDKDAWDRCPEMKARAKTLGFDAWACHDPKAVM